MSELEQLKKEKNAIIIAHFYQDPVIQEAADYVGDSYGMALYAQKQDCRIAVVAGVRFMAETIKVLNPEKKVLLPDLNAGCSLADSCTPQIFEYFLSKHPDAFVMTYINSSLPIKAMSDVICTSSNALKIADQIPKNKEIVFGPDQHLGHYLIKKMNRPMALFPGNCFVHTSFSAKEMMKLKIKYPDAEIVAHPECEESVLVHADFIGSTSQILNYTQTSPSKRFIVMTEPGIIHQMKKANPHKEYILGPDLEGCSCNDCPHMKLNTYEKLIHCLQTEQPEITIEPQLAKKALKPLQKMIEMAGVPS